MLFSLQIESGTRRAAKLYRDALLGTRLAHAAFGDLLPHLLLGCMFAPLFSTVQVRFKWVIEVLRVTVSSLRLSFYKQTMYVATWAAST